MFEWRHVRDGYDGHPMDASDLHWNSGSHDVRVPLPGGGQYRLAIDGAATDDRAVVLQRARARAAWIEANLERVREGAADRLLDLYNDTWRSRGDNDGPEAPVLDRRGFAARLKLSYVCEYEEGNAMIYFGDDDMFWGHSVEVLVSPSGELEDADIVG
jgi:hypothetical protein